MAVEPPSNLPAEAQLALAHTPAKLRDALRIFLELDARIARIVAGTNEPMLGQMRLTWWREMLGKPIDERPTGDAVLDGIGEHWAGREAALIDLIDGWEVVIVSEGLSDGDLATFSKGRAAPFVSLFGGANQALEARLLAAGVRYAMADIACGLSAEEERRRVIETGLNSSHPRLRLPRSARGLAVLEALALRSLKRGGRPLMEGRGAALVATRAAIFGR